MVKFCLINNLYKPYSVGGAEKYVEESAKQLVQAGNKAVIITSTPFRGWKHRVGVCMEDGIKVYRVWIPNIFWYGDLPKHNFFGKLIWHFIDIFNFWGCAIIKKILMTEKPDEIQTHNLMGINYKISNFRHIHFFHDVQLVEPSGILPWNHKKDKLYQKIYSWVMKWRMGRPDEIVCLSEFMRDFYQSRGFFPRAKWNVQQPPNPPLIRGGHKENYSPLDKGGQRGVIGSTKFFFVGSLVEHKGIRVLMQAWSKCHSDPALDAGEESLSNASLHLAGDGILYKEIDDWAKTQKNVIVHGRLEGNDLEKIYQESDVLIFPSICLENRPTVILEAKKYGLKIIASDTGGVREFIGEGDVLVEPGNIEKLRESIEKIA